MMDPLMTPEFFTALISKQFTAREWLLYYRNIWQRNVAAGTIDVHMDMATKADNPEFPVQNANGMTVPVKARLEERKISLEDTLKLLASIDQLLAMSDEDIAKMWTPEALKVAEDMMPKPAPKVGDPCTTPEGKEGTLQAQADGSLTCVMNAEATDTTVPEKPTEQTAADQTAAPAPAEQQATA